MEMAFTVGWNSPDVLVRNGYLFRFQWEIAGNLFQFADSAKDLQNIIFLTYSVSEYRILVYMYFNA